MKVSGNFGSFNNDKLGNSIVKSHKIKHSSSELRERVDSLSFYNGSQSADPVNTKNNEECEK